jgi:predicted Zn-dependent protease
MRRLIAAAWSGLCLSAGWAPIASVTRPVTEAVGKVLLSPEEERRLGDQLAAQVLQKEQVFDNPEMQNYVAQLGQRLVAQLPLEQQKFDYRFIVLFEPETVVNAFALPGGHIFIYTGLIQAADSEAELASVLAHEVAHVAAGHPSDVLAAQVGASTLRRLALGREPGMLDQLGSTIAVQGYLAAYSREAEREADELGLGYLVQAGYAPSAVVCFFEKLARMGRTQGGPVGTFLASHPAPGQRAGTLNALIRERGYGEGQQAVLGDFERIQAQLGPSPVSPRGGERQ